MVVLIKDVWHQLTTLNPGKPGDSNGCHPHDLQEVKDGVVIPLYLIYKKSLKDGKLPTPGKDALVIVLYKR